VSHIARRVWFVVTAFSFVTAAVAQSHVPPDPPAHLMPNMTYAEMVREMDMDDRAPFGQVLVDRLERQKSDDAYATNLDLRAWYGGDYNKALFNVEAERADSRMESLSGELLWDRIFARWWSVQSGVRYERIDEHDSRLWAAIGIEGLAPYWFDVEATVYFGESGRTAFGAKASYELLATQRLIVNTEAEALVYGKSDRELDRGAGLAELNLGMRLRYELRREIAPYLGVEWQRRDEGTNKTTREWVALSGLRMWF
jgi:copper resistance protein B